MPTTVAMQLTLFGIARNIAENNVSPQSCMFIGFNKKLRFISEDKKLSLTRWASNYIPCRAIRHRVHTRVWHIAISNTHTCHRTNKLFTRVSHTSKTIPAQHMRTRTCGTMHYMHASHAMCAPTLLSLKHLHHAPSDACAQLTRIYTVMCEMVQTSN